MFDEKLRNFLKNFAIGQYFRIVLSKWFVNDHNCMISTVGQNHVDHQIHAAFTFDLEKLMMAKGYEE